MVAELELAGSLEENKNSSRKSMFVENFSELFRYFSTYPTESFTRGHCAPSERRFLLFVHSPVSDFKFRSGWPVKNDHDYGDSGPLLSDPCRQRTDKMRLKCASFIAVVLFGIFCTVLCDDPEKWKKKDVRDYTDADLERLFEQWEVRPVLQLTLCVLNYFEVIKIKWDEYVFAFHIISH